jgi:energy-coupling factor transporter transmembrane protein EcfT
MYFGYVNRWWKRKQWNRYAYMILFIAGFAVLTHVMLDCINGFQYLFWPSDFACACPNWIPTKDVAMMIDGTMLLLWLLLDEKVFNPLLKWVNKALAKK